MERIVLGRQFGPGQKRGVGVGKTKRSKGTKGMVVVDGQGLPLGNHLHVASTAEVRLPAGRDDSDPRRERLARRRIQRMAPHRSNRRKPPTQDGQALRRYRRRWTIARTFAWLGNFRRLVVRWDRSLTSYQAFFHIACFRIVLRRVLK